MKRVKLKNGEYVYAIDKLTAKDVYEEIYEDNVYLQHGIQLHDHDTVFDVGANIGLFTKFATKRCTNLKVFAFEPIPEIFKAMENNLKENTDVKLFNIGLSNKKEEVIFNYYPKVSADSTANPFDMEKQIDLFMTNYHKGISKMVPKKLMRFIMSKVIKSMYKPIKVLCPLDTISNIIKAYHISHIDLLKLDAENAERQVLEGILEEDWPKIKQIAMEIHTTSPDGETLIDDISNVLESKGFSFILDTSSRYSFIGVHMLYAVRK